MPRIPVTDLPGGHLARARTRQGTGPAPGLAALIPGPARGIRDTVCGVRVKHPPHPIAGDGSVQCLGVPAVMIKPDPAGAGICCRDITPHDEHPLTLDGWVWCTGLDPERAFLDSEPPEWDVLKVPDGDGTDRLDWHYGPTSADPDPGKMWHTGDCGGEVWVLDEAYICRRCGAQTGPDLAAHLFGRGTP